MTALPLNQYAAADTLRSVAVWLETNPLPGPDDPSRVFIAEDVHGIDVRFEQWPDGRVTLMHRDYNMLYPGQWSKAIELGQVQDGAA